MGCLILQTDDKLMTGAKVVCFFFSPQKVNLCEHVLKRGDGATTKKKKIQMCILLNVKKGVFLPSEKVDPTYLFKCPHIFAKASGK